MTRVSVLFLVLLLFASCSRFIGGSNSAAPNDSAVSTPLPQFTDAQQALDEGNRLLDVNETEKAIEAFNQAIALNPDLAEAYFKLGIAYALIENANKVSAVPGEGPEISTKSTPKPDSVKAFEKAVEAYKRLIDKNPEDDVSYFNLGRALNKLFQDEDAEKALEKAVKLKPDDVEYLTELGAIRIKLARYREAVEPLEKALQIDPENSEAQDLFEDAEAGRRRVEYTPPKKDEKGNANSKTNANTDANVLSNANVASSSNSAPPSNAKRPSLTPPANKPARRPQ
jgi:tetratricopeptide (TPR) repeat protein